MKPEEAPKLKLAGQSILIAAHIHEYLVQLLNNDRKFTPFEIVALEKEYIGEYEVQSGEQTYKIRVGGIVDRIDRTAEGLRIVDYKTGRNLKLDFKEWSHLIDRNYKERRKEIFQTLIYSDILVRQGYSESILPAIYKLDDLFQEEFVPNVILNGEKVIFQRVCTEFRDTISEVLSEIFSINTQFDQTKEPLKCSYCPYNKICQK
jgi:ATP-dependent helicase/DNAse subunit B